MKEIVINGQSIRKVFFYDHEGWPIELEFSSLVIDDNNLIIDPYDYTDDIVVVDGDEFVDTMCNIVDGSTSIAHAYELTREYYDNEYGGGNWVSSMPSEAILESTNKWALEVAEDTKSFKGRKRFVYKDGEIYDFFNIN